MRVDRGPHGERGGVAVLLAVMVTGLLGVGVLMVDVGVLYVEGRQIQTGAENAALAIARTCADTGCDTDAGDALANANSGDAQTLVETVCGTAPGLTGCTSNGERDRFGCRDYNDAAYYVQVQTRSLNSGANPSQVPGLFRPEGSEVRACARAAYGSPAASPADLPFAFSECEFNYWLGENGGLSEPPFAAEHEAVLFGHTTGNPGDSAATCPPRNPSNNMDSPGGFGWLDTVEGTCDLATTVADDDVDALELAIEDSGNSVPKGCEPEDFTNMLGTIVRVPIYSSVSSAGEYTISRYAAFHLTGYRLSSAKKFHAESDNLGLPCGKDTGKDTTSATATPSPTASPSTTTTTPATGGGGGSGGGGGGGGPKPKDPTAPPATATPSASPSVTPSTAPSPSPTASATTSPADSNSEICISGFFTTDITVTDGPLVPIDDAGLTTIKVAG